MFFKINYKPKKTDDLFDNIFLFKLTTVLECPPGNWICWILDIDIPIR